MIVAISSDRGLCGGIHSGVSKAIKAILAKTPANTETKLFIVGDKVDLTSRPTKIVVDSN
jgi:F-type H+-transporting ATPase subunit gamma